MKNNKPDSRPVFLNLLRIRQPVTALTSIGHRISGVLLFLSIPVLIMLLDRSLSGPQGFAEVVEWGESPLIKLVLLLLVWAAVHHFLAGIRFLLLDVDLGIDLETARKTAKAVNIAGGIGVLIAMVVML